ncbi:hypothetical protein PTSG_08292 [Salpingoeca rosetta]|uniref:Uncharacterized protein n=1 Tax=Salpingoeca rosetta (strain ATCC 50818 / BSB-021) TaxID=946362 RepID=F2UJA1_SALR5|nr:uncharacterized protein PTSG_08292 [Salpingoeca rosetta]EGD77200.1 hypothetical protein PTSG_08292 [Salpingoeca rosetta]|eukprot:XP_004990544.1 hypothetical protein PTSG_08292 [Salpingoeca rosetta]
MSLYDGLGLDADEIAPDARATTSTAESGTSSGDPEQKKKKVAEGGGWSVSQSMFAAQMRRKQAEKARGKTAGSTKKKNSGPGAPSLMKPLGHGLETVTIIKRKAGGDDANDNTGDNAGSSHDPHGGSSTRGSTGSGHGLGDSGNGRHSRTSNNTSGGSRSEHGRNGASADTHDAEPFREDPAARREIRHPYSPWRPNDFELIRMKKKERQGGEDERRRQSRRRRAPPPSYPGPMSQRPKAAIAPPSFLSGESPPPDRPSFAH